MSRSGMDCPPLVVRVAPSGLLLLSTAMQAVPPLLLLIWKEEITSAALLLNPRPPPLTSPEAVSPMLGLERHSSSVKTGSLPGNSSVKSS